MLKRKWKHSLTFLLANIACFSSVLCLVLLLHLHQLSKMANDQCPSPNGTVGIGRPKTPYPKRENMGICETKFGRILVLVFHEQRMKPLTRYYGVAQASLECYLKSTNYTFKLIDLDEDIRANQFCVGYNELFFRKHCIASAYLPDSDWLLVLDADTGVVNPNHCIEEWIDDRVDLIFYERFFNWEIMSGNYLVRNTPFARQFLLDWANLEFSQPKFSSADNGALQLHILKTVLPSAKIEIEACTKYWNSSIDYDTLMAYTTCVRSALGAQRIWPPKLRIMRRAHGFCRDWFMTGDRWADTDFMFHGWKPHNLDGNWKSPFEKVPNASECIGGYLGWNWRNEYRISVSQLRQWFGEMEHKFGQDFPKKARVHAHLEESEIGECYPKCDEHL
ncbi:hypothetical protein niasHS_013846 [Heterodera schachtii]|uniref:Uncharacterized protein n=1 Tax=Heterodera schachtii TaxID=97005 RepID=A0ABD2IJ59_HETSC